MDVADLTEQEAFKAGFLAFCKEAGLSPDQIDAHIKRGFWPEYRHYLNQTWNPTTWGRLEGLPEDRRDTAIARMGAGLGTAAATALAGMSAPVVSAATAARQGIMTGGSRLLAALRARAAAAPAAAAATPAAKTVGGRLAGFGRGVRNFGLGVGATGAGLYGLTEVAARKALNPALALAGLPIAAGLGAGGLLGLAAAKMTEPNVRDEDLQAQEIEQVYRTQAKRLKARRDYEKYRQARGL